MTASMRQAFDETNRRRAIQVAYNEANNITPQSILKPIDMSLIAIAEADYVTVPLEDIPEVPAELTGEERQRLSSELEGKMKEAARKFEFELAAQYRDRLKSLQSTGSNENDRSTGAGRRRSA
jgi:excinuclease ABC subunit B